MQRVSGVVVNASWWIYSCMICVIGQKIFIYLVLTHYSKLVPLGCVQNNMVWCLCQTTIAIFIVISGYFYVESFRKDLERNINPHSAAERAYAETTPLLRSSPLRDDITWNCFNLLIGFLLLVSITGIVIGIYLLIVEENSENILPPISPRLAVRRFERHIKTKNNSNMEPKSFVVIVQADKDLCRELTEDTKLLDTIQISEMKLPYNFLVSSTAQILQSLGWENKSLIFPDYTENSVVLAFIGDFSQEAPTDLQVLEVTTFLEDAVRDEHLTPDYIIIGKKIKEFPKHLFLELSKLPQWSEKLSDVE